MNKEKSFKYLIWFPFLFCMLLSFLRFQGDGDSGAPAFFFFLPLCFFSTAMQQLKLYRKITELDSKLHAMNESSDEINK